MGELKDLTLKVDVDTYKAFQNYLHNELKITKEDMETMIERVIMRVLERKMEDTSFLTKSVDRTVKDSIARLGANGRWVLEERIDSAVEKIIGEFIMKRVREQLNGATINLSH